VNPQLRNELTVQECDATVLNRVQMQGYKKLIIENEELLISKECSSERNLTSHLLHGKFLIAFHYKNTVFNFSQLINAIQIFY
jgi:hypothetical protein